MAARARSGRIWRALVHSWAASADGNDEERVLVCCWLLTVVGCLCKTASLVTLLWVWSGELV